MMTELFSHICKNCTHNNTYRNILSNGFVVNDIVVITARYKLIHVLYEIL